MKKKQIEEIISKFDKEVGCFIDDYQTEKMVIPPCETGSNPPTYITIQEQIHSFLRTSLKA